MVMLRYLAHRRVNDLSDEDMIRLFKKSFDDEPLEDEIDYRKEKINKNTISDDGKTEEELLKESLEDPVAEFLAIADNQTEEVTKTIAPTVEVAKTTSVSTTITAPKKRISKCSFLLSTFMIKKREY